METIFKEAYNRHFDHTGLRKFFKHKKGGRLEKGFIASPANMLMHPSLIEEMREYKAKRKKAESNFLWNFKFFTDTFLRDVWMKLL